MNHDPPRSAGEAGAALRDHSARPPFRIFIPALVIGVVGLLATLLGGWQMSRWARAHDDQRFLSRAELLVGMIQQKMERYESAFGRLRDACAPSGGEMTNTNWNGWMDTLDTGDHYPNVVYLAVAPRISADQREAFERRAAAQITGHPGRILTTRTNADDWLPVWRRSGKTSVPEPAMGDDLLDETPQHPSLGDALRATAGWVHSRPSTLRRKDGEPIVGFWFAVPLTPFEFTNRIQWQWPHESGETAARRRSDQRAMRAIGLVAAFIGGERFLDEYNNSTNADVHVQLFTSKTPTPDTCLNPGHLPPPKPRYARDMPMRWYGRGWTARVTTTPLFEASMLSYRAWLVWGGGGIFVLAATLTIARLSRGRWREAALAARLRDALAKQERLSRDLHDGTLQSVYGVGLALERVQRHLRRNPKDAELQVAETMSALQGVIRELRDFIRQTDPGTGRHVLLGEALAGVVSHQRLGTEMKIVLDVMPGADQALNPSQSLQLLNIVREALSNSVRHSGGHKVCIALERRGPLLRLEVSDDGRGFDLHAPGRQGRGLANLAARVHELGGTHQWKTAHTSGSRLVVEVPIEPSAQSST